MANNATDIDSPAALDSFLSRSFLDLEKIDENLFRSRSLWKSKRARGVYGGQIIGQALVAVSQGIPEHQHIHSLHSYFLNKGKEDIPVLYHVDKIRDGRTYCTRSVKAVQSGVIIFMMQASFKQEETFKTIHQSPMPKVPYPDELETMMESLDRLRMHGHVSESNYTSGKEWNEAFPAVTKWVGLEQHQPGQTYYPKRHLWIKAKGHIAADLHQNIHKCCLAYMSDAFLLPTALMRLAPMKNRESLFMASLDHSMWFHAPCRADQWLLYELETEHIGDGRALCRGSIWDINGTQVVTFVQEGVLRYRETSSKL